MEFLMQSIRGSTFLEEVGESTLLPPAAAVGVVKRARSPFHKEAVDKQVLQAGVLEQAPPLGEPMAADLGAGEVVPAGASAEGQLWAASGAVEERRESSPAGSELSTGKITPRAPGWNKRVQEVKLGRYFVRNGSGLSEQLQCIIR
ncbi:uncharacterized protein LOC119343443 [Triticum dicoccoides]|uniref:uncharacterized protein LOC119343443 n=1 Tax=Triticum dicoccoides TaxID=85692 RepID=UPI0018906428|nr:uncharacterized protein LOC119343443 [Triticum dicoccoides]